MIPSFHNQRLAPGTAGLTGVLCMIALAGAACDWPLDEAGDPFRCDPLCDEDAGLVCWEGRCVEDVRRTFRLPLPLFSAASPRNQPVAEAKVLPASDDQLLVFYRVLLGDATDLQAGASASGDEFLFLNYGDDSISIGFTDSSTAAIPLCQYDGTEQISSTKVAMEQSPAGTVMAPQPLGKIRPSGPADLYSEGYLVLFDFNKKMSWDFWMATTQRTAPCKSLGGGRPGTKLLEAGAVDYFNVNGLGTNKAGVGSARLSGVPLLAGLILPEDVASGQIRHALSIAFPGGRNLNPSKPVEGKDFYYPATFAEDFFYSSNVNAPANGQRIRLKARLVNDDGKPLDEDKQLAPITQMVLRALREYGAYLLDSSSDMTLLAEDYHSARLNISADRVNELIGNPPGSPLPASKTNWQIVMEKLSTDLRKIPLAEGPWPSGQDPSKATITTTNFEFINVVAGP